MLNDPASVNWDVEVEIAMVARPCMICHPHIHRFPGNDVPSDFWRKQLECRLEVVKVLDLHAQLRTRNVKQVMAYRFPPRHGCASDARTDFAAIGTKESVLFLTGIHMLDRRLRWVQPKERDKDSGVLGCAEMVFE